MENDKDFESQDNAYPLEGIGLCLSGGGYRAMLFHIGSLWRLNQLGYLPKISRISSVSGGSISSAFMGLNWQRLQFDADGISGNFEEIIVNPIRRFAETSIDLQSVFGGLISTDKISDKITKTYDQYLFHGATLQDFPDHPRFIINATNVQSGALWRFMKPYMRDYRVGEVRNPKVSLALAVAASSAFPPFLSPVHLKLSESDFTRNSGEDLQCAPYTTKVMLSDGGVYDNLGLETVWKRCKTVLVSDAGGKLPPEPSPKNNWGSHSYRILDVIDNQVRSLRKRHLIDSFQRGVRAGAYWGIRTDITNYPRKDTLLCPFDATIKLANVPTRLTAIEGSLQEKIINWGYAVTDAAVVSWVDTDQKAAENFPYPDNAV